MNEWLVLQCLAILEHIEVPFLDFIHDLKNIGPLSCIDFNDLSQTLLIFFELILVCFSIFSMQLFQEIVQVPLKPSRRVIDLFSRQIYPGFCIDILLSFTALIHC